MLVKPVLTYNCATWRLTRKGEEKLDSFHQKQLKHLICKTYLISLLIKMEIIWTYVAVKCAIFS